MFIQDHFSRPTFLSHRLNGWVEWGCHLHQLARFCGPVKASFLSMTSSVMCEIAVGLMKHGTGVQLTHIGSFPCMFVPGNPQRSRNAHHRMGSEIYLPLIFITHPLTGNPQWPSSSTGIDVHLELISNNLWKAGYFPVFIAQICVSAALGSMRQCKESMYNIRCTFSREPSSTVLRFPSFLHFIPIILLF